LYSVSNNKCNSDVSSLKAFCRYGVVYHIAVAMYTTTCTSSANFLCTRQPIAAKRAAHSPAQYSS